MSPADSARLELAKRAYQATGPSELEVQTGVRRARLALRRQKPRRKWLLKGLVFVVLALGSLAYAKPHALGELVERGLPRLRADGGKQRAALTSTQHVPPAETPRAPPAVSARPEPKALVVTAPTIEPVPLPRGESESGPAVPVQPAARRAGVARKAPASPASPAAAATPAAATPAAPVSAEAPRTEAVSDWGRVGQALARGDESAALSALGKLSESDDPRTRDKADLGRAQLMMAHGNREQACSLARALTRRRAGGHIERQALMLLKDCSR